MFNFKQYIIINKRYEIRYYLNKEAFNLGIISFSEEIEGDSYFVRHQAELKLNSTNYEYYEIIPKQN